MPNALIVVDMQRCFMEEGNALYCGPDARQIIPNVQALLAREEAEGTEIFFTADSHDEDDLEFRMWPAHCIRGRRDSEIIPELRHWVKPANVIAKRRYSAFFETDLEARLKALRPDVVKVVGVCTDICVMHTVTDLRNRDHEVIVYEDAVASFDHEAHRFALQHLRKILGADLKRFEEERQVAAAP